MLLFVAGNVAQAQTPTFYFPFISQVAGGQSSHISTNGYLFLEELGYVSSTITKIETFFSNDDATPADLLLYMYACPSNDTLSCIQAGSSLTYRHSSVEGVQATTGTKTSYLATFTDMPTSTYAVIRFNLSKQAGEDPVGWGSPAYPRYDPRGDADNCKLYNGTQLATCNSVIDLYYIAYTSDETYSSFFQQPNVSSTIDICNGYDEGGIVNGLCNIFAYLFVPNDIVKQKFQDEQTVLAGKIPWGWWTQVSGGFAAVSSTVVATTSAFVLQIPFNGTTHTIPVIDYAEINQYIPSSLLSTIRTLGGMAMWALFGAWIWHIVTGNKQHEDAGDD